MNQPPSFPPFYQPPPPFTSLQPLPPPPPPPCATAAPDLPTALSTLASLLRLTETTLSSLPPFLPTPSSSALIPCPFNPNHLLPHSSLFSHYLSCPSSLTPIDPQSLPHSLQYTQTLRSTTPTNSFTQTLQNPSSTELVFSLENFLNFPQNFFYSNCPGAVVFNPFNFNDSSSTMLTLPEQLSAECANFRHNDGGCLDEKGFSLESIRILPSEIWAVRNEIEGWVDYPSSYSCRVLRSILRLWKSDLLCLLTWVIESSPKYGVFIDLAMRDHIVLLFKLCLKAIIREAIGFSDLLFSGKREDKEWGADKKMIDCPVLIKVMMWLGSQLSVLYGEVSGKFFGIKMLKECLLDSSLSSSCFPVLEKAKESSELKEPDGKFEGGAIEKSVKQERCSLADELEGAIEKIVKQERSSKADESVQNSMIFVSQVAAAVAALYERSWLEEKIKKLRDTRQLPAYPRVVEHENISKSAREERQKRSDYRPIIEHDRILWQQAHNQEPNRIKTREELLAEERDYKRRRMSYRGKKMKRTTTQVMRDMIDEFMDEIKRAGGLGFAKEDEEAETRAFGSSSVHNSASDILGPTKNQSILELSRGQPCACGTQLYSDDGYRSTEDKYHEHHRKHKRDSQPRHENADNGRSFKRDRHDRRNYSRSPDRRQSEHHSHGRIRNRGTLDDPDVSREITSRSSDGHLSKLYERKSRRGEENRHDLELGHKHARKKHKDHRSGSVHSDFVDRYDP